MQGPESCWRKKTLVARNIVIDLDPADPVTEVGVDGDVITFYSAQIRVADSSAQNVS